MEWRTEPLEAEIAAGRCIAFVGAGFSAPVCRPWRSMLLAAAESAPSVVNHVKALLESEMPSARELETAAQLLEDALDDEHLIRVVGEQTRRPNADAAAREQMEKRRRWLKGIPFTAILTTNFDDELTGDVLQEETYSGLLRQNASHWWQRRYWDGGGPPVLKLHGDLGTKARVTLSRQGYRRRLYAEPGYLNVLRALFLTKTVLFLGFSFTDEYLNELRSEVLSYIARGGHAPTLAYALLNDVSDPECDHYRKHEGITVFRYHTKDDAKHEAFDRFLEGLHERTSPVALLGRRLAERRILWVDPSPDNNERGREFLAHATAGRCVIDVARSVSEALSALANPPPYDVILSRWGHHPDGPSDACRLLEGMHARGQHVPTIIFASGHSAAENREAALRLGALEYTSSWEALFEVLDRRFGGPP
jgi:CheY-like chemotaxis protein